MRNSLTLFFILSQFSCGILNNENQKSTVISAAEESEGIKLKAQAKGDGSYFASVVNSTESLEISILENGSLLGSSLIIEPDTFESASEISLLEGAPLAIQSNLNSLEDINNIVTAGSTLVISSSSFEDPKKSMPVALRYSTPLGLANSFNKENLAILYMAVVYGEHFKILFGLIPFEELEVDDVNSKIKFKAKYFGAYQPVYVPSEFNKKVEIEINQDILSKSGEVVIVDGGDKTPPIPGADGELQILDVQHDRASISFDLASDDFSDDINLSYLAYFSTNDKLDSIAEVESAQPYGDYKRKISTFLIKDLDHSTTYHVNIIVRDEMNNKAIYKKSSFKTTTPNFPPEIESSSPTASSDEVFYKETLNLSVAATDQNTGDTLSYSWNLNGGNSSKLVATGANAVFSPDINDGGLNIIEVKISDGVNSITRRWDIKVFLYNPDCKNLAPGNICTIVGNLDIGLGSNPVTESNSLRISPNYIEDDGSGNLFISDGELNVVWFYNRSGTSVTRLGYTIAAGVIDVIAGSGAGAVGTDGDSAKDFGVPNPHDIAYDSVDDILYIASYDEGKVIRVNSVGVAQVIFGSDSTSNNAAVNTNGDIGTNHVCRQVAGLALDEATDELYMGCFNSNSIKKATDVSDSNLSNILGYIVVGNLNGSGATLAATTDGPMGSGGAARTDNPWEIELGPDGILYFTEYGGCHVRAVNLTNSSVDYFGTSISIAPDNVGTIVGSGSCSVSTGPVLSARIRLPVGLALNTSGTDVTGFFISNYDLDRISYANNSGSSQTIGGTTISDSQIGYVMGTGQGAYNGEGSSAKSTKLNLPMGLQVLGNDLYVADRLNYRVRKFDISVADGPVDTLLGSGLGTRGNSGDLPAAAEVVTLNKPASVAVSGEFLYYGDTLNFRIKAMKLDSGLIQTVAAKGAGDGGDGPAFDALIRYPSGMQVYNGILYFVDEFGSNGPNRTCKIRGLNLTSSTVTAFGNLIDPSYIIDIAGDYESGCNSYISGSYDNLAATQVPLQSPSDLAIVGDKMYIALNYGHCILEVGSNGTVLEKIGQCGSMGNVDETISSGNIRLRRPEGMAADPNQSENFFFTDQTDLTMGQLKYANFSSSPLTILGVTVAAGSVKTVKSVSTRYLRDVTVYENQICVSAGYQSDAVGSYHGVNCYDYDSTFGAVTLRVGVEFGLTQKSGRPFDRSQEGVSAFSATLYGPAAITFDEDGNLYIVESEANLIRKVAKWW